jgi:hypothetical protein
MDISALLDKVVEEYKVGKKTETHWMIPVEPKFAAHTELENYYNQFTADIQRQGYQLIQILF